jgi:hypothetical protein
MPWETEGDGVRFSGHLTDLMTAIVGAYDEEIAAGTITADHGVYVTAVAIVLREILLEQLANEPEAVDFLKRVGDTLEEAPDGTVTIQTFALLDDVAEHIEDVAWRQWLADPAARAAIADVTANAFAQ